MEGRPPGVCRLLAGSHATLDVKDLGINQSASRHKYSGCGTDSLQGPSRGLPKLHNPWKRLKFPQARWALVDGIQGCRGEVRRVKKVAAVVEGLLGDRV
jgi:hypothetical protein